MDDFIDPESFLSSLRTGRIFGRRTHYLCSLVTCGLWYVDKARETLERLARPSSSLHH